MKISTSDICIEPFDKAVHDRDSFSCGVLALDNYFQKFASQDVKRDLARVFVALDCTSRTIAGYYSLSATSFHKSNATSEITKNLPKFPLPAALLGRLAISKSFQRHGLGTYLVMDALNKVFNANEFLGITNLIVDAIDKETAKFYQALDFLGSPDESLRLFLPIASIRKIVQ